MSISPSIITSVAAASLSIGAMTIFVARRLDGHRASQSLSAASAKQLSGSQSMSSISDIAPEQPLSAGVLHRARHH
jgi:hypothetical protein